MVFGACEQSPFLREGYAYIEREGEGEGEGKGKKKVRGHHMRQHATLAVALLALVATQSGRCSRPFAIPAVVLEVADETAEHSNADLQSRARVTAQATARGISARDVAEAGLGYPAYRYDEEDGGRVERVRKVAYLKTHKTASTTLGSILYRHAARNHLRIFCSNRANCEVVHIQPLTKIEKSLRDHPNGREGGMTI